MIESSLESVEVFPEPIPAVAKLSYEAEREFKRISAVAEELQLQETHKISKAPSQESRDKEQGDQVQEPLHANTSESQDHWMEYVEVQLEQVERVNKRLQQVGKTLIGAESSTVVTRSCHGSRICKAKKRKEQWMQTYT